MPWRRGHSLQNLYYHLRMLRPHQSAARRKLYRYIAEEKKRLIESGADAEKIRLQCRTLANPKNKRAQQHLLNYAKQLDIFDVD